MDNDILFQDPASQFENPQAVLNDVSLSKEDKRKILEQWKLDLIEHEMAESENMPGDEEKIDLSEVLKALAALD